MAVGGAGTKDANPHRIHGQRHSGLVNSVAQIDAIRQGSNDNGLIPGRDYLLEARFTDWRLTVSRDSARTKRAARKRNPKAGLPKPLVHQLCQAHATTTVADMPAMMLPFKGKVVPSESIY